MPRRLIVEIVGDSRALEASYRRSVKSTQVFGREIGRAGRGAIAASGAFRSLGRSVAFASSAFLGGAGLIAVTRAAVDAASNLVEQQNKADVVFGDSASAVKEWSKTTASSLGIAQDKALEFAGVFGNILVPMGESRQEAAKFSTALVQLASDMASFNNASPEDTLEALKSGIVGQVRPLRQYGVFLSDARIKAEALADGIVKLTRSSTAIRTAQLALNIAESKAASVRAKSGKSSREYASAQLAVERAAQRVAKASAGSLPQLTDQQKLLARLRIIYKDTGDAQGDFGRTLGTSLANKLRVFRAEVSDLEAELGLVLLPAISKVVDAFNKWLGRGDNKERLVQGLRTAVDTLGSAIGKLWRVADRLAQAFGGWKTALELAAGAWVGFKLAGIVAAQAVAASNLFAAGVVESAWKAALISTGWGVVAVAAGAAAAYIITHWEKVKVWFKEFWLELKFGAYDTARAMVEPFSHLPSFLGGWARQAKASLTAGMEGIVQEFNALGQSTGASFGQGAEEGLKLWAAGQHDAALKALEAAGFTDVLIQNGKVTPKQTPLGSVADLGKAGGKGGKAAIKVPVSVTPIVDTQTWRDRFDKVMQGFQLRASRAKFTKSLQDDLAVLKEQEAAIRRQLKLHKGDLDLQQQLVEVQGERRDLEQQITDNAKQRRQARQFRALGLTATGDDPIPGIRGLRRQLGQFERNVEGTFLDTKKTRSVISRIRRVLAGGLGSVGRDVRDAIKRMLDDLDQQLKEHRTNMTRFRHANTAALLAGLGLDPDEIRRVRARLATVGAGGVVPGRSSAAYGKAGAMSINTVNVYGVQDPREFEHHMTKRARSRPVQRRGI